MSLLQHVTKNNILIFRRKIFFHIGHEKPWIRIRIDLKCWIRIQTLTGIELNTDPKHYLFCTVPKRSYFSLNYRTVLNILK